MDRFEHCLYHQASPGKSFAPSTDHGARLWVRMSRLVSPRKQVQRKEHQVLQNWSRRGRTSQFFTKKTARRTSEPQAARPGPSGFLLVLLGIPEHPPPSQMFLQSFVPETKSLPGLHHLTSQQKNSSGGNLRAPIPQLRKDQLSWMRPPVYNHCTFLPASRQRDTHF